MGVSLSAVREDFIMAMGRISAFWGFNKAMGQIYGVLYLNARPLSLDDIAASLEMSKGNVSLNTRSLERWGLIRRVSQKSDRKDYYEAELDFWKIAKDIIRERDKKEFDQALAAVSACLTSVKRNTADSAKAESQFLENRLANMKEFFDTLDTVAKAFLALDKLHVTGIPRLGLSRRHRASKG